MLWNGYNGSCKNYQFIPTDSDWALGFYNWGQKMPWYYVGPTWFSPSGGLLLRRGSFTFRWAP